MKSIEKNNPSIQIEQGSPIELHNEYARLYDGELLSWGLVRVNRKKEEEVGVLND